MKTTITLIITLLMIQTSFAQNNRSKKVELELNQRLSFYKVDGKYNLLTDTIFHTNEGFRIFSGYDIQLADDSLKYIIVSYPNWKPKKEDKKEDKKGQSDNNQNEQPYKLISDLRKNHQNHKFHDGLNTQNDTTNEIDSFRAVIFSEVLDSLDKMIAENRNRKPNHAELVGRNDLKLALSKSVFDSLNKEGKVIDVYSLKWRYTTFTTGFMTVPFKLRPKQDSVNFNITTDITLGAYLGVKKKNF